MKKNSYKKIRYSILTVFLTFFLLEITLRIIQFKPTIVMSESSADINAYKSGNWLRYVAHPVFGHVNNPDLPEYNKMGFLSIHEYPIPPRSKQVVVGLYGGSVAEGQGPFLEQELNSSSQLSHLLSCGYNFKVANFGVGAYSQPAQFYTSSFSSNWIDIAVNLDGYNDMNVKKDQGQPKEYTVFFHDLYGQSLVSNIIRSTIVMLKKLKLSLYSSAIHYGKDLYLLNIFIKSFYHFVISIERWLIENTSGSYFSPTMEYNNKKKRSFFAKMSDNLHNYSHYTNLQKRVLDYMNIPFVVMIQPNQYIPGSKRFYSQKEMKTAFVKNKKDKLARTRKTLMIFDAIEKLKQDGVQVYDLTRIFFDEKKQVYVDNCCHLNEYGIKILAKEMTRKLSELINASFQCEK